MSYGRWFEVRQNPLPQHRLGRYITGDDPIMIGAPVEVVDQDEDGRGVLALATGDTAPKVTEHGIIIWEQVYETLQFNRGELTDWNDYDTVPANTPVQLCHGTEFRFKLRNWDEDAAAFHGQRDYTTGVFIAGLGATPTLARGDFVGPGVGDLDDGFWAETTEENAWAVITRVLETAVEVQCVIA